MKINDKHIAFIFGVIFVSTILIIAIKYPKPTIFQYEIFKIILALAAAGIAAIIPGLLSTKVGKVVRASGAIAVFVIIYFFTPARLAIEAPPVSDEAVILYLDIGKITDAQGRNIASIDDNVVVQLLRKYGSTDPTSKLIAFSLKDDFLESAKKLFADVLTSTGELKLSHLRIGLSFGQVIRYKNVVKGPAVEAAIHTAVDPFLSEIGMDFGILADNKLYQNLSEQTREEHSIAELKLSGIDKTIHRIPISKKDPVPQGSIHIFHQLKEHENIAIVCLSLLEARLKRESTEAEISARLPVILDTKVFPLLKKINEYEGYYPAMVNYLLFPTVAEAVLAAEHIYQSIKHTGIGDEVLEMTSRISVDYGAVHISGQKFSGTAIERASALAKQKYDSSLLLISNSAIDKFEELKGHRGIPFNNGVGFLYRPRPDMQ